MNSDNESHTETTKELRRQVHESRSTVVKGLLILFGSICVGLGILGILLPVLPTTPFLLLAAICYSHSSERFYICLLSNRFFGTYIRDWRENRGISMPVKLWVIFVLAVTMGISVVFFIPILAVKILCTISGIIISAYILSLPTKSNELIEDSVE
jgi:uncharacterized protein